MGFAPTGYGSSFGISCTRPKPDRTKLQQPHILSQEIFSHKKFCISLGFFVGAFCPLPLASSVASGVDSSRELGPDTPSTPLPCRPQSETGHRGRQPGWACQARTNGRRGGSQEAKIICNSSWWKAHPCLALPSGCSPVSGCWDQAAPGFLGSVMDILGIRKPKANPPSLDPAGRESWTAEFWSLHT